MGRNIVVCCDGTGNEIEETQSNVLNLYRVSVKDENQLIYYHPGLGTISDASRFSKVRSKAKGVLGLATGYGLDDNVLDTYRFLVDNYREGDNIYLFGFSRGAFAVRVLAGMLHMVGLLQPNQCNLSSYALVAYKKAQDKKDYEIAWRFQDIIGARNISIKMLGCWDTVSSVIVPRLDKPWSPISFEELPFTLHNPSVAVFRHALAIDERRAMFRVVPWKEPQEFIDDRKGFESIATPQDIKQVWFAGVHSDIGGGYPEQESGPAKVCLAWMLEEAKAQGLRVSNQREDRYVYGAPSEDSKKIYQGPDPLAELHDSMNAGWKIAEWYPKRNKYKEWSDRKSLFGRYLPRAEPRKIPADALIHESVWERVAGTKDGNPYEPVNLPNART